MSRNRTALVLGGGGYLGTHIVHALDEDGVDVVTASRTGGGTPTSVRLDVLADGLAHLCGVLASVQPDILVNCIGSATGGPAELVQGNVLVPLRLLEAVGYSIPQPRFIHLGSAGEYGAVTPAGVAIDEDTAERPVSLYGISKLAGTRLLLTAAADSNYDVVVLRVFNPLGPGAPESSMPGRSARLMRAAVRDEPHAAIDMAPLDSFRDFADVRDVAAAVVAVAQAPVLAHRLYNVAGGVAVCSRDIVNMLAEEAGFHGEVREQHPRPDRSGNVSWQRADISRAQADFGWRPRHELSSTIKELWKWAS